MYYVFWGGFLKYQPLFILHTIMTENDAYGYFEYSISFPCFSFLDQLALIKDTLDAPSNELKMKQS